MHVFIRRFDNVACVRHVARRAQTGVGELLRHCPGFRAYYVLEAGEGVACSITIFDDRETARVAHEKAMSFIRASMVDLIDGEPQITEGEVLVSLGPKREPASSDRSFFLDQESLSEPLMTSAVEAFQQRAGLR